MAFNPGDVVTVEDFPGVAGVKRRPAVILSSATYRATRQDAIVRSVNYLTSRCN